MSAQKQDKGKSSYKQTNELYDHPRDLADLIYRKLGVGEGFVSFQHKLQFLEVLIDTIQVIKQAELDGMTINEFTKKLIKTKLNMIAVNKFLHVWEKGGYLYTRYAKIGNNVTDIVEDVYLFSYPDWELTELEEITRMPALFSLKSKDEVTSEDFFMRINEMIPEREAYRWHEPRLLCEVGKLDYESNGVLIPFFKNKEEILASQYYTMHVPRNYYDIYTSIAWREAKKWVDIIRINLWQMAKEMEEIDFKLALDVMDSEEQDEPID